MAGMRLNDQEMTAALARLPAWSFAGGKLHREYRFASFMLAMGFMMTAALAIEALNHHPEWSNVYTRVVVDLVTHDAGGVTAKDVALAEKLEELAGRFVA